MPMARTVHTPRADRNDIEIVLPDGLADNLDALALKTGVPKGEHVRRAIADYIAKQDGFGSGRKDRLLYHLPTTSTT